MPAAAVEEVLIILTIFERPGSYRQHTRSHLKQRVSEELRQAMVGLTFRPIGREQEPTKLPTSPDSTMPDECAGWYHLSTNDLMRHLWDNHRELYLAQDKFACGPFDFFLISPDQCRPATV